MRHFRASWLFNDLELPAQDVAHQLGHTDGGALVQRLDADTAPTYRQLAEALVQMDRSGDVRPLSMLDDKTEIGADPEATHVAETLDRSPGAWERMRGGVEQANRGEGTPLDELA